jgi:RNA polymerase primary sigma factor
VNANGDESVSKYFKDVRKSELLTPEKEVDLAIRIKDGDESAINELVESNLKFVISIAKEYQGQGLPLSDLISEGNFGLVKAATRYDHTRGFRFISYAVWWVRQSILQSLCDNSRMVRLPANVVGKLTKFKKDLDKFEVENGREPNNSELLEMDDYVNLSLLPKCTSLNITINEDGNELYEVLEDVDARDGENFYNIDDRVKGELDSVLSELSDREKSIVKLYYGIDSEYNSMTLEEIGEMFDITKERVRQIKERAIRKIRNNAHGLYDALND